MKHTIKKIPKSQVEIEVEIDSADFDHYLEHALEHAKEHVNLKGFRKGNVPDNMVREAVGEDHLLSDAADMAVKNAYAKIIEENKLEPIGQPNVQVLKLAKGNPFVFKVTMTLIPDVELPDYKKITSKVKKEEISVKDEEIDDALIYIQKSRAKFAPLDREAKEKDFVEIEYEGSEVPKPLKDEFILGEAGFIPGFEKNIVGMKVGEQKEFSLPFPKTNKEASFKVKVLKIQSVELPELNDDFAKSLGNFENMIALKSSIKEGITFDKQAQEKDKRRNEILQSIAEGSKVDVPESLIIFEKERLFQRFQEKIAHDFKISFEDYLKSVKQDEKTLKESFAKEAEKKVKSFLTLREIGRKENIVITDEEITEEANKTIKNYPPDVAKKIDISQLKEYAKGVIYNEKVFQILENLNN